MCKEGGALEGERPRREAKSFYFFLQAAQEARQGGKKEEVGGVSGGRRERAHSKKSEKRPGAWCRSPTALRNF